MKKSIICEMAAILLRGRRVHWDDGISWWRHQMETFSALLAICAGKSPVPGEFHSQRPVTRSFDVFFDLHLNKRLSKQSWGWWFELSCQLWRPCDDVVRSRPFHPSIVSTQIVRAVVTHQGFKLKSPNKARINYTFARKCITALLASVLNTSLNQLSF